MFSAGFIQKTIKVDQIVKLNHVNPQRKLPQNVPEDSGSHHTKAEVKELLGGAGQLAPSPTCHPLPRYVSSP
jgi:hypothetical protein